ncbi:unnamed protein product [Mycena citricolor]|uniref:Uncharacterized protein n=1 Tax=Mycena citricolor TaxID=2018698 RepID=A0AAD2HC69_9AGAR|nr:unnamed protein product [Mycena citricolor]
MTLDQLLSTSSNVLGTVALVFYTFPCPQHHLCAHVDHVLSDRAYYRRLSVETEPLESVMRSTLRASDTETLTGISTIRAEHCRSEYCRGCSRCVVKLADAGPTGQRAVPEHSASSLDRRLALLS